MANEPLKMRPTMQLRFKRKVRGPKRIVLLEQMWTDDTTKVREWREVPMVEDEAAPYDCHSDAVTRRDENWGNR